MGDALVKNRGKTIFLINETQKRLMGCGVTCLLQHAAPQVDENLNAADFDDAISADEVSEINHDGDAPDIETANLSESEWLLLPLFAIVFVCYRFCCSFFF